MVSALDEHVVEELRCSQIMKIQIIILSSTVRIWSSEEGTGLWARAF